MQAESSQAHKNVADIAVFIWGLVGIAAEVCSFLHGEDTFMGVLFPSNIYLYKNTVKIDIVPYTVTSEINVHRNTLYSDVYELGMFSRRMLEFLPDDMARLPVFDEIWSIIADSTQPDWLFRPGLADIVDIPAVTNGVRNLSANSCLSGAALLYSTALQTHRLSIYGMHHCFRQDWEDALDAVFWLLAKRGDPTPYFSYINDGNMADIVEYCREHKYLPVGLASLIEEKRPKIQLKREVAARTSLMKAVIAGDDIKTRQLLHEVGSCDVDHGEYTALMYAATHNNLAAIRLLLVEAGMRAGGGGTALMMAVCNNNIEGAQILLHYEKTLQQEWGWTALMIAAYRGHLACATLLAPHESGTRSEAEFLACPKGVQAKSIARIRGNVDIEVLLGRYE